MSNLFNFWLGLVIIVAGTIASHLLILLILKYYKRIGKRRGGRWLSVTLFALERPAFWSIWVIGTLLGVEWVLETFQLFDNSLLLHSLIQVRRVLFVLAIVWIFLRGKKKTIEGLLQTGTNSPLYEALSKLATLLAWILCVLIILSIFRVPLQALLTFGGVGTLAFSWAAKDFIANLFGGLMIHLNRPFALGDAIISPNKNFRGVIKQIGWYLTEIQTFDCRPATIPNSLMTDAIVENLSRIEIRKIELLIGVRYEDFSQLTFLTKALTKLLQEQPELSTEHPRDAYFVEFASASLNIKVRAFAKLPTMDAFLIFQQKLLLSIGEVIESFGVQIAYPTQTIQLDTHKGNNS